MRYGYVYLLCNRKDGAIYLGMTNNLAARLGEHKEKRNKGFTADYDVTRLVWFERFDRVVDAIQREKTMKGWPRQWKINTIEKHNPDWNEIQLEFDD
jgi:putative endonuclease